MSTAALLMSAFVKCRGESMIRVYPGHLLSEILDFSDRHRGRANCRCRARFLGTPTARLRVMPAKNKDLHGSVPDNSRVALLLVDVINDLEFAGGDELATNALPAARNLARLIRRARRAKVPIIYANRSEER